MKLHGNWNFPTSIRFGAGRIIELPLVCKKLGLQRPLLVTDPGLAKLPMVENVVSIGKSNDVNIDVFCQIKGNPTGRNVKDGVAVYNEGKHDGIIAFGGGSGIDAAKAIALVANQFCSLWDLEDIGENWLRADPSKIAPIIAVPTTAGTGSEVGRASVITDEINHVKKIIFHPKMMPEVVIADPELTIGLPAKITAATGMDALSHNLEAFCAPGFHPMAKGIAAEGISLVKDWLEEAVADGNNIEARSHMLIASTMGATAFQRGLGAMHALAHPLGALYDAHHGLLNAILMPFVLVANRDAIKEDIDKLALSLGLKNFSGFLDWMLELRQEIGIPHSLKEIGIGEDRAPLVGEMAHLDPSAGTNPVAFGAESYSQIFRNAVSGKMI